ncbi:MAG: hypothetical protein CVT83_07595 [Alphaproteobacteria bacterium HGW-Alphaproteobacteria-5]|nr:MAG: hypothetical protein CVT83_07595 [Alphaproteobacteria bacterium HGW-Alphaproteobacteria-5]
MVVRKIEQSERAVPPVRDGLGAARLAASALAVAAIKAAATAPGACGPDIPVAPARGACRVVTPVRMVEGSEARVVADGHRGVGEAAARKGVMLADVFDRMAAWAEARGEALPFTSGQVAMARLYRNLVERHEAGGMRCSSLETGSAGGGTGGEFIDAYVVAGDEITRLQRRIGTGAAMVVRRVRPSARGGAARGIITDRELVDAVCLHDRTLSEVLDKHGWAIKGEHRERLRVALAACLDRMQGYDLRHHPR